LEGLDMKCHIWEKREIEFYYPPQVHHSAQQGDAAKEVATKAILDGDQGQKYRDAAKPHEICVPTGKYLRRLLVEHVTTKDQLDQEIRDIVEKVLIPWKNELLGI
jgi:hypothetical protein